jgi:hypothetical protein
MKYLLRTEIAPDLGSYGSNEEVWRLLQAYPTDFLGSN